MPLDPLDALLIEIIQKLEVRKSKTDEQDIFLKRRQKMILYSSWYLLFPDLQAFHLNDEDEDEEWVAVYRLFVCLFLHLSFEYRIVLNISQ